MSATFAEQLQAITARAEQHERALLQATRDLLEAWAADATISMRRHAPWQNRTGLARYGAGADNPILQAQPTLPDLPSPAKGDGLSWRKVHPADLHAGGAIVLITDAPYGIYLETANGGAYAIIMPTVATLGPQLTARLRAIWRL